jgi:hypothetical protein
LLEIWLEADEWILDVMLVLFIQIACIIGHRVVRWMISFLPNVDILEGSFKNFFSPGVWLRPQGLEVKSSDKVSVANVPLKIL